MDQIALLIFVGSRKQGIRLIVKDSINGVMQILSKFIKVRSGNKLYFKAIKSHSSGNKFSLY